MKKVIGILALLAMTGNIASAELLKNFKANGSVEALGQVVNNSNDFNSKAGDKFGDVKNRVMINANFDLNDDASATVSLNKCDRTMGKGANADQSAVTQAADSFFVSQAYLTLKNVFGVDHKIGRQYYGNDGDIVLYFGPANWYTRGLNANNVAFDGWTSNWSKDKLTIGAAMAKLSDAATATDNKDQDLYGVTAAYDLMEVVKPAAYVYEAKSRSTGNFKLNNLVVAGVKATGKYMGVNYGGEYAMNMGNDTSVAANNDNKYKGSAMKFNADYGLDLMGKLVVMGEYAMGTGDKTVNDASDKSFQDINANYRPGLIMGGVGIWGTAANNLVITGLNNLTTWNVGANWTPSKIEKLDLGVKYYDFSYTEKVGTVDHIGTEADLVATWNHSQNVALKAGLAMFMPDKYKLATKDDSVSLYSLYMNVKF